jgi:surface antigen
MNKNIFQNVLNTRKYKIFILAIFSMTVLITGFVQLNTSSKLHANTFRATECGGFSDPYNPYQCCANGGNSTWWAAYKRPDIFAAGLGAVDAKDLWSGTSTLGFPQGQIPQVGALAVWGSSEMYPNGHVGHVERVFNNTVFQMSEMNCNVDPRYNPLRIVSTLQFENFQGFIYKKETGTARIEVRDSNGQLIQSSISVALANGQTFGSDVTAGVYTLNNVWAIPAKITANSKGLSKELDIVINPNTQTTYTVVINTSLLPTIPTPTHPANGTSFSDYHTVIFTWTGVDSEYQVEVLGGPSTSNIYPWQIDTSINIGTLPAGYSYTWRVRSRNAYGTSDWSQEGNFNVVKPTPLGCELITGGGIVLFTSSNCSGSSQRVKITEYSKLVSPFNNNVYSIYVKSGWSIKIFENKDKTGGKLCIAAGLNDLSNLKYNNGSPVIANGKSTITAIKVTRTTDCK